MWLFTRYGFFSIACADGADGSLDPQTVMVRARRKTHLERLQQRCPALAGVAIVSLPHRDYRYRIIIPKATWTSVVLELAQEQEWSNFKSESARFQGADGADYVNALHRVWEVMYGLQQSEARRTPGKKIMPAAAPASNQLQHDYVDYVNAACELGFDANKLEIAMAFGNTPQGTEDSKMWLRQLDEQIAKR